MATEPQSERAAEGNTRQDLGQAELGPCGKHPRKIAETPAQAWYRAYESPNADKDPAQHCPECDRAWAQRGPDTELAELVSRKPEIPLWSHSANMWIYKGEQIAEGTVADHRWLQDLSRWADEVEALADPQKASGT